MTTLTLSNTDTGRTRLPWQSLVTQLLADPTILFARIADRDDLSEVTRRLLLLVVATTAPLGAVLGTIRGGWQIAFAAIKLPLLLLGTLCLCYTSYWSICAFLRCRIDADQIVALCSATLARMGLVVVGLSPLLWLLLDGGANAYQVDILLVCAVLGVAGLSGIALLIRGLTQLIGRTVRSGLIIGSWTATFMLVGAQLAWVLRPFLVRPQHRGELVFLRAIEGNVFSALREIIQFVTHLQL